MADETRTSRDVIRAAIGGCQNAWGGAPALTTRVADDLAERIDHSLFGDGSHEESAAHWRANAAEEKRKKQHVSELLGAALRERDEARTALADLEAEVRRLLRLGTYAGRPAVMPRLSAVSPEEASRIAALLREPAAQPTDPITSQRVEVRALACPYCYAPAGEPCHGPGTGNGRNHEVRTRAARAAQPARR